jgi:hypothetical protein
MPSELFKEFEERPARCSAVFVSEENIDRIAAYYAQYGYQAITHRDGLHVELELQRDGQTITVTPGVVLSSGHPPTITDYNEFRKVWRMANHEDKR